MSRINPGLLGEKQASYLCAIQPPRINSLLPGSVHVERPGIDAAVGLDALLQQVSLLPVVGSVENIV